MEYHLLDKIPRFKFLVLSFLLASMAFIFFTLYYKGIYIDDNLSVIFWISSIVSFFYSLVPMDQKRKVIFFKISKRYLLLILFVSLLFFISHLWNFNQAPWNKNGLFDDAAWDIYFAKNHVFNNTLFQPAYFDTVGYISREVVFAYYITIFFKIFGYNLLTFNLSLLLLGFITVLFTALVADSIFGNTKVTVITALVINFFPLHFMHIFMGHRYAIAAPLMIVSIYFLYESFKNNSYIKAFLSAVFAALCWSSAIMGKQYLLGLFAAGVSILIFGKKSQKSKENISITIVFILGLIVSSLPLITYIIFNYKDYSGRENGLLKDFVNLYLAGGYTALEPYVNRMTELFFAQSSYLRQFLPNYYIIPLAYYLLLVPGVVVVFAKRRLEIIFLATLPIMAAFISGAYDFRVLIAVPLWVITISFFVDYSFFKNSVRQTSIRLVLKTVCVIGLVGGLYSSGSYINKVSQDPNYLYLLPHKDVSISRLVQDIAFGSKNPTSDMKFNELNRPLYENQVSYDTLFCPYGAYAIAHLYLQDYDDKSILALCDQGIQLLKSPEEILADGLTAVNNYQANQKDLKLIWETSDKSNSVISFFDQYKDLGSTELLSGVSDGIKYSIYILTIRRDNINKFKSDIARKI